MGVSPHRFPSTPTHTHHATQQQAYPTPLCADSHTLSLLLHLPAKRRLALRRQYHRGRNIPDNRRNTPRQHSKKRRCQQCVCNPLSTHASRRRNALSRTLPRCPNLSQKRISLPRPLHQQRTVSHQQRRKKRCEHLQGKP